MSVGSLWVLVLFAFWGVVFLLMIYFCALISRGRDGEEAACDLPTTTGAAPDSATTTHAPA